MGVIDPPYSAYEEDAKLMASLGLKTTDWPAHEFVDLGTVVVHEEDTDRTPPTPAAEVKVKVYACPAQFWRFTVLRPQDESIPTPRERIEITTGSGSFSQYWPTAKQMAENRMNVGVPSFETEGKD